jgi:hypothetical protein
LTTQGSAASVMAADRQTCPQRSVSSRLALTGRKDSERAQWEGVTCLMVICRGAGHYQRVHWVQEALLFVRER